MRVFVNDSNIRETVIRLSSIKQGVISLDTETTGLKWNSPLFALQLAVQNGDSYYFNFNTFSEPEKALSKNLLKLLDPLWNNPNIRWIIANAKFDMRRLEIENISLSGEIYDLLIMAKIQYNKYMSYSLDSCLKRIGHSKNDLVALYIKDHKLYTKYNVDGKKTKEKDLHYDRVPLDIMTAYGFDDAEANLILYKHQTEHFELPENKEQIDLVHSNIELVKTVYKMESRGVQIDTEYCKEMFQKCNGIAQELIKEIEEIVGRPYKAGPIWLSQALKEQGIQINLSAKGNAELGSAELEGMDNAVASLIGKLRETEKEGGFYGNLHRFQVDSVIHTNYRLNGTDTLRFSSNEPNLQNIPSCSTGEMNSVRHAFKPRKGYYFASIDYVSMEFRLCVDIAGESNMIKAIQHGLDPHQMVADTMGADRKSAKVLNFLTLYGGGAQKLSEQLGCSIDRAKVLRHQYFLALPKVKQLHNDVQQVARSRGYVRNKYGMRYFLNDDTFAYKMVNHLIQGLGACIIRQVMNKLAFFLEGHKSAMVLQVHDELMFEIHETEMHLIPEIKRIMEEEYKAINGMGMACDVATSDISWNENTFKKWGNENGH